MVIGLRAAAVCRAVKRFSVVRTASVTGGAGGVAVTILAADWFGIAVLIITIVVPIAAVCWVLADPDRPQRLAWQLSTWRYGTPTPPRRTPATASHRANGQPSTAS
ncbi:hypothetical protein ACWEF6_06920 [Amycolatopsis sp. NPDC004772]